MSLVSSNILLGHSQLTFLFPLTALFPTLQAEAIQLDGNFREVTKTAHHGNFMPVAVWLLREFTRTSDDITKDLQIANQENHFTI
jgi:hypothetical protein